MAGSQRLEGGPVPEHRKPRPSGAQKCPIRAQLAMGQAPPAISSQLVLLELPRGRPAHLTAQGTELVNPLREHFLQPHGFLALCMLDRPPGPSPSSSSPRRAWRKTSQEACVELQRGSRLWGPLQCALIFWVQGSRPVLPHRTGSPSSGQLSKPLARLEQDFLGPCH